MAYFKCKGKLCQWQKWNSAPVYSYSTETYSSAGLTVLSGDFTGIRAYYGSSYTFDPSTGLFTLGGSQGSVSTGYSWLTAQTSPSRAYGTYPGTTSSNIMCEVGDGMGMRYDTGHVRTTTAAAGGIGYKHTSYIASYTKGSTNYGYVYSLNDSAYPTNGRASDGYWYVRTA